MNNFGLLEGLYQTNHGRSFWIQYNRGNIKQKWKLYPSGKVIVKRKYRTTDGKVLIKEYEMNVGINGQENQRQILDCEVVIDIDQHDGDKAKRALEAVQNHLTKTHTSFRTWFSGGSSYHVHLIFSELEPMSVRERCFSKRAYLRSIQDVVDAACPGEKTQIDLSKASGKTLIQMEDMPHHRTGRNKSQILAVTFEEPSRMRLEELKREYHHLPRTCGDDSHAFYVSSSGQTFLDVILNTKLLDGRKRAAFYLVTNLLMLKPKEQVIALMLKWNEFQGMPLTEEQVLRLVDYHEGCTRAPGEHYVREFM